MTADQKTLTEALEKVPELIEWLNGLQDELKSALENISRDMTYAEYRALDQPKLAAANARAAIVKVWAIEAK